MLEKPCLRARAESAVVEEDTEASTGAVIHDTTPTKLRLPTRTEENLADGWMKRRPASWTLVPDREPARLLLNQARLKGMLCSDLEIKIQL